MPDWGPTIVSYACACACAHVRARCVGVGTFSRKRQAPSCANKTHPRCGQERTPEQLQKLPSKLAQQNLEPTAANPMAMLTRLLTKSLVLSPPPAPFLQPRPQPELQPWLQPSHYTRCSPRCASRLQPQSLAAAPAATLNSNPSNPSVALQP